MDSLSPYPSPHLYFSTSLYLPKKEENILQWTERGTDKDTREEWKGTGDKEETFKNRKKKKWRETKKESLSMSAGLDEAKKMQLSLYGVILLEEVQITMFLLLLIHPKKMWLSASHKERASS